MRFIDITFSVFKYERSSEVIDNKLEKVEVISVTWLVSKCLKFKDSKLEHIKNIPLIFSTFEVLKPEKSNDLAFFYFY